MTITIKGLNGAQASRDKNGVRNYVRRWKVFGDAPPTGTSAVDELQLYAAFAAMTPPVAIGRSHPLDGLAVCIDLDFNLTTRVLSGAPGTGEWEWDAVAKYSSDAGKQAPTDDPDPTHRPPRVDVGQEIVKIAALKDEDDKPVVNAANEPIPYEIDKALASVTIKRTVADFDFEIAKDARLGGMVFSVNGNDFIVPPTVFPKSGILIPADEGLVRKVDVATAYISGKNYLEISVVILHDPDKHLVKLLNQGYMCYEEVSVPPSGTALILKPILVGGTTPNTPRLLDKTGKLLDVKNDDPTSVDFNFHKERTWDWILG